MLEQGITFKRTFYKKRKASEIPFQGAVSINGLSFHKDGDKGKA